VTTPPVSALRTRVEDVVRAVRKRSKRVPSVGIVLGSGLGGVADEIGQAVSIPFGELPGVPAATVPGHEGRLVLGRWAGVSVAVLRGRVHLYEGHSAQTAVLLVRALVALGARTIVLTNAAGGLRPVMEPGDVAVIVDHLNMTGHSPLVGPNDEKVGPRFPDMTDVWTPRLVEVAARAAAKAGIRLHRGVYAQMLGPSYETPAEVRALQAIGADLVGMSTAIEAIAARHAGARVAGLSCVTNLAAGLSGTPLGHAEVQQMADRAAKNMRVLLRAIVTEGSEETG